MAKPMVGFGTRLGLILLSFAGIIIAMTGILELATGGVGSFYPPEWRFPGYSVVMIIGGYLMMAPMGWLYMRDAKTDD
ncbi:MULTISPECIES: hypothetical protein [Ectothiorhodospira]|nr:MULTISPECIES: hypothetical protein [Ectothiorhodospira]MCG5495287.1 hypothetical protein [Ectothiorhodospira variabilis]MCG5497472.1 hypothetical protein [Ectothiorhodospira variabilis]MCG5504885.1 hypothetical protein [Ectothiorhodospira variabilis]MCG5508042.1 hypothetical protein [Ectothiorhodospira variabilis]MCG5524105.1 hypothetical protein [Ectothiorhodospira haloalkaliphila]